MKIFGLLLAFTVYAYVAIAAQPNIKFEKHIHDFGEVEESGKFSCDFEFTNEGNEPLVVTRVQTSCSCAIPGWTKSPVEPGQKGKVNIIFNPVGLSGKFSKSITVFCNAKNEKVILRIRGNLVAENDSVATTATSTESFQSQLNTGNLQLSSGTIHFKNIYKGRVQTQEVDIENTGGDDLIITIDNQPRYLDVLVIPATVKAGKKGKVTITFDSNKVNGTGTVSCTLDILINGKTQNTAEYQINVLANITGVEEKETVEKTNITEQKKSAPEGKRNAPVIKYSTKMLDLGLLKNGEKGQGKIVITNKGINPLEIKSVDNQNKEMLISKPGKSIMSNKTDEVGVLVDTKGLNRGTYRRTFTIKTNDPDYPVVLFGVSWKVE